MLPNGLWLAMKPLQNRVSWVTSLTGYFVINNPLLPQLYVMEAVAMEESAQLQISAPVQQVGSEATVT